MKIVISPAKSLNYQDSLPTTRFTQPSFLEITNKINDRLVQLSKNELGELMHISDKLADLNYVRNKEFELEHTTSNSRPAVYAFDGDVYTGLEAYTIKSNKLNKLQDTLRILSGLYGILKPLDLIQPYRLEMGTKLSVEQHNTLYEIWKPVITKALNEELKDNELFLNLASNEYFKAVDTKLLKVPVITPVFKDWKNDKLKIISFYAKKARGLMVRYILDTDAQTIEDLKGFNYDGYGFSEEETIKNNELVFTR
ncbi:peroxide stress protein YaaA [Aquimarina sp. W85]|uniref:peroxide stress protein YaaA n=1 Tax=Aquimarina rhodophyticola TaxID=3342246 RepID=UPI00366BFC4A